MGKPLQIIKGWQCLFCKQMFWNVKRGQQHQQTCPKKPTSGNVVALQEKQETASTGVSHITHGDVMKCLDGDHSECESFEGGDADEPRD